MSFGMDKSKNKIDTALNSPQAIQARIALAQWEDFKKRYVPVGNKFLQLVRRSEGDKAAARGEAASAVSQGFDRGDSQLRVSRVLNGDSAASSATTLAAVDNAIAKASAGGSAMNEANRSVEDTHLRGLQKAVSVGRNIADDANLGLRRSAVLGAQDSASRAEASAVRAAGQAGAAGTVVGALGSGIRESRRNTSLRNAALDDAASNPNSAYISTVPATERDGNTDIPWQRFNYGRQG